MTETTFEVRVPTALLQFGIDQNEVQRRLEEWLVLSLFIEDCISSGKAAQLLGMSWVELLALLRERGIAYVNYSSAELAEDLAAVETLKVQPNK